MSYILASKSPRRRELLSMITNSFTVLESGAEEIADSTLPFGEQIAGISKLKARAVKAKAAADDIIIAADTAVIANGEVLGKPRDTADARRMLELLSGKAHLVITAFTVLKGEKEVTRVNETKVYFKELSEKEIEDYINTGEPFDKAGAYAVQGKAALFIERLEGDFFSVMGLPVCELYEVLEDFK